MREKKHIVKKKNTDIESRYFTAVVLTVIAIILATVLLFFGFEGFLQKVLIVAGIATFVGLFIQYLLTYLQEKSMRKVQKIIMLTTKTSFSIAIAEGVAKAYARYPDCNLSVDYVNPDNSQDRNIRSKIKEHADENCDGLIVRLSKPIDSEMQDALMYAIKKTNLILMDYNFSDSQIQSQKMKELLETRSYGFIDSNWKIGCDNIVKALEYKINSDKKTNSDYLCLCVKIHYRDIPNSSEYVISRRNSLILEKIISHGIQSETVHVAYYEGQDEIKAIVPKLKNFQYTGLKNLIIICGCDLIAHGLMEYSHINRDLFDMNERVIFIGYDGLKDYRGKYIVDFLESKFSDYITVDVETDKQGEMAAETMEELNRGTKGIHESQITRQIKDPRVRASFPFEYTDEDKHGHR